MLLDRRTFLMSAASAAALGASGAGFAQAQSGSGGGTHAALNALMERAYQEIILSDPETRTSLGLDKGADAAAKSQLDDRSAAGIRADQQKVRELYRDLRAIPRDGLTGMDAVNYDTVNQYCETVVYAYDNFDYGTHSWPEPYTVSQLGGTYQSMPDFLDSQHAIDTAADAEAYLSRLSAYATQLDNETARLRGEYAMGVIPPDFVIDKTVQQMETVLGTAPAQAGLTTSLARRTAEKNIAGDWAARAERIVSGNIYPAIQRQRDIVRAQRAGATHDAGVWRLPEGPDYYAYGLRYATTTTMNPDEIHQLGLDQIAELSSQADRILRARGLTQGTVAERLGALGRDPQHVYPNTDAGKTQLIADLNTQMADIRRRLPNWFGRLPRAECDIRRVPPAIEAGAPGGYYQSPALDGSRPGAYYINLRDTAEWPKWTLPTLTYHEAVPGHHHQIALALEATDIPMLRRLMGFSAYSEGWGLYSEQLADEMGMYENDPLGRLGYLQSFMFRAARLVVDTGLHHKRWSREQGIRYMVEALGDQESSVTTEVERYCVWPGQATSYKVGQTRWLQLRERARQQLGDRFDIKSFHDTALAAGAMPLAALERVVDDWVAARRA
ncbi:DUF885 family protein [Sphingosinicella sp. LHD-64]|uniref:DUF885 domain-containing protein n=1 Tax=Sphingosinicella sp. LHD-64 TaxID=3072139 RepID=UPI00280C4CEC|nr:DUF885 family protein [Sphingosinicella sp. LHD-64]MDQ8755039.1 DUF885 family protein [Sphingosinicella sp. LHD-64]